MIKIVGLGPGSVDDLTIKTIDTLKKSSKTFLRTYKHPNVEYIKSIGIEFETFDDFYDKGESFDEVYEKIARRIVEEDGCVYAVPGHPLVAERSVELILEYAKDKGIEVEIIPALSFIDAIINALRFDPSNGFKLIDGLMLDTHKPDLYTGNVITQVYSRFIASEIKIKLMEYYDDEQEVYVIRAAGVKDLERVEKVKLYEIDRLDFIDYMTTLYIPPVENKKKNSFDDLVQILDVLRSPGGCPWDREQTHDSLKRYMLEECYEIIDAIEGKDYDALCEELGDLLLQIVFHSQIAKENEYFDINDVVDGIVKKMVRRHPHVFGDKKAETADEVLDIWEKNKMKEKNVQSYTENLKNIPMAMPALLRSLKVQEKAAEIGFDWDDVEGAISKVKEELLEVLDVYKSQKNGKILEEIGDLLFAVVNVARFLKVEPELALTKTTNKFITRFEYIEKNAFKFGKTIQELTLEEMDKLWEESKKFED
ncbi:Nucleoside triphosphate pyrophosphohydrolase [Caloramator mitchellensis]|uniref:Nucleoside triphosphate pyrophosphohydrolase n=1 Tax=Caloramator mitchellensis TaxID=908809 RepID=A0A0R3JT78_CALMK|nr:nucleoside triphosphate pyrophosphohydrolase [Caloramator mitchellensis]KRQ86683.1 Nucleoside triphosphate pyrophosphohydrolase [Caloramator mitchellensis]